jgi:hypothetical protein
MWCWGEAPTLSGAKGARRRRGLGNGQRRASGGRGNFGTVWRDYPRARGGGRDVEEGAGYVTGRPRGLAARIARPPAPGRKKNLASWVRAARKAILSGHVIFGYVSCGCVVWL